MPVGVALPYASMMLESRQGQAAVVPNEAFAAGLKPSDSELQKYYAANRARYMIPEQRSLRIAIIGPAAVQSVVASDQEIAAYYKDNEATYGSASSRSLTQVVVPDQKTAAAIAARAKAGATMTAAAAPAGTNAAVTDLPAQNFADYSSAAGNAIATAVFAAPAGAVVGPLQSDFGWVVVKIGKVEGKTGKTLAQARGEIAAKLNVEKRKEALETLVDKVQTAIDEGSNFGEAAECGHADGHDYAFGHGQWRVAHQCQPALAASACPCAQGRVRDRAQRPARNRHLARRCRLCACRTGDGDPGGSGALGQSIRDRVARDWVEVQSAARAKAAAQAIAAKVSTGMPLADAVKQAGVTLPAPQPLAARRLQIATASAPVPPPLQMLFSLAEGKSRMIADAEKRGFYVVKVDKIIPGNAMLQPSLISRMQTELQESVSEDYARQFLAALRHEMKVERNEQAIAASQARLKQGAN